MTKIKNLAPGKASNQPKKVQTAYQLAVLKFVSEMKRLSLRTKILFALASVAMLAQFYFAGIIGLKLAMLYMIADNAKKSGRADGNVYMKNGRIRGMAIPANPRTASQTEQRSNLGSLSSSWASLTQAKRDAWDAFSIQDTDRFGRVTFISGKSAYVALNRNLFNAGGVAITDPPAPVSVPSPTGLTLTGATLPGQSLSLAFLPATIPANNAWLIFATRALSTGKQRISASEYRLIDALATGTTSPANILAAYQAKFGNLVAGTKVFVRVIAVHDDNGIASAMVATSDIIA
jgi:hypothetical protein